MRLGPGIEGEDRIILPQIGAFGEFVDGAA
jgi:hypothetical protein